MKWRYNKILGKLLEINGLMAGIVYCYIYIIMLLYIFDILYIPDSNDTVFGLDTVKG